MRRLRTVYLLLGLAWLSGCSTPPAAHMHAPQAAPSLIVGSGTGIRLTLDIGQSRRYTTLSAKTVADLQSLRLYLVTSNVGELTVAHGPFAVNKATLSVSGDSQTATFHNVPDGTYYIAVAAHDGLDGTGLNITNAGAPATIGGAPYYVSDGGGDADHPGRVTVSPSTLAVSSTTPLTLHLVLQDG